MRIYASIYNLSYTFACIYATVAKKLEVGGLQIHIDSRKPSHGDIWKICCSPSLGKHMVIASAKTRLESTTSHAEVRDKRPEGIGKYGLFLSAVSGTA